MSKLDKLMKAFRIPQRPSGTATWSNIDLLGSRHTLDFSWSQPEGTLDVQGQVDGHPSFRASFAIVAGSLRLRESSGFPDEASGARKVSQYLEDLIMLGNAPVVNSPESRLSP